MPSRTKWLIALAPAVAPLTAQSVALIIKKRARAAGIDPRESAGHSLRAGYATQAARAKDTTPPKSPPPRPTRPRRMHPRRPRQDDVAHVL